MVKHKGELTTREKAPAGTPGRLSKSAVWAQPSRPKSSRSARQRHQAGGMGGGASPVSALPGPRTLRCCSAALTPVHPVRHSTNVGTLLFLALCSVGLLATLLIAKKVRGGAAGSQVLSRRVTRSGL